MAADVTEDRRPGDPIGTNQRGLIYARVEQSELVREIWGQMLIVRDDPNTQIAPILRLTYLLSTWMYRISMECIEVKTLVAP